MRKPITPMIVSIVGYINYSSNSVTVSLSFVASIIKLIYNNLYIK